MIKQGRISQSVSGFKFMEKYGISEYKNPKESAVFFGCYNPPQDFNTIINHKALGILIWLGSDSRLINPNKLQIIKQKTNIKHIAQSIFIANDLSKAGIEFKMLPIHATKDTINLQPLGDCIYCYAPKHKYNFYGGQIIDELKKILPNEKFIITSNKQYPREKIIEFYKKSFIGLRLTLHDGLPETVVELGLMGRRCIFNDKLPNTIAWKTIQDIVRIIKKEKLMIGQINIKLANSMFDFLNIDNSWLDENYWK